MGPGDKMGPREEQKTKKNANEGNTDKHTDIQDLKRQKVISIIVYE